MWLRVVALLGCASAGAVQMDSSVGAGEAVAIELVRQIVPAWMGIEPTLLVSVGFCVCILVTVVTTHASRVGSSAATSSLQERMWPMIVVGAFTVHCLWLYHAVLVKNIWSSRDNAVGILMGMSIVWWLFSYMNEVWVKKTPLVSDEEEFTAGDVYSDLTVSMFNVAVRFMMQASMLLIVVHVAQETVDSGVPEVTNVRWVINFGIALTLVLYMFVASSDNAAWEDVRRLRGVRAVKHVGNDSSGSKGGVVYVAPGDFYIRFAMCVVTTGVFHRFLVLSYPLLVFTTFAGNSWVVLVKDILAITIVCQLDNLMRSVSFKVYYNSADVNKDED